MKLITFTVADKMIDSRAWSKLTAIIKEGSAPPTLIVSAGPYKPHGLTVRTNFRYNDKHDNKLGGIRSLEKMKRYIKDNYYYYMRRKEETKQQMFIMQSFH